MHSQIYNSLISMAERNPPSFGSRKEVLESGGTFNTLHDNAWR